MSLHVPRFDSIDYSRPEDYTGVVSSFAGDVGRVTQLARDLKQPTDEATLGAIWQWIDRHLKADQVQGEDYHWRTASETLERGRFFGCAEHALVYGSLARASGIPIVWVKSLDADWIEEFVRSGRFDGGRGHVYLEVFLAGGWRLLDATQDCLFDVYDPHKRLLPGQGVPRYAYDKGGDARELVLSLDWEPWKRETKQFFRAFDLSELRAAEPATSGRCRRLAA